MASPPSDPRTGVRGRFYSGNSSRSYPASLSRSAGSLELAVQGYDGVRVFHWHDIEISPRVGNAPRYLYLPDKGVFETPDNEGVDAIASALHQGLTARLVHRLESHLGLILIASVVTVAATALTFTHGIPLLSSAVAHALPDRLGQTMAEQTLARMDDYWLEPSTLPESRQQALQAHFAPLLAAEPGWRFQVRFRHSDTLGANAMALPDGTIVFTDELVKLARDPDELSAILAHEMGHVVERHGLQGVVQSSLVGWLIVMMTGDLSAASDMVVVAPAVLMDLSYSRAMEREADGYALELMLTQGLDPLHFAIIMRRLSASHDGENEEQGNGWADALGGALSTHPMSRERIARFEEAAGAR